MSLRAEKDWSNFVPSFINIRSQPIVFFSIQAAAIHTFNSDWKHETTQTEQGFLLGLCKSETSVNHSRKPTNAKAQQKSN